MASDARLILCPRRGLVTPEVAHYAGSRTMVPAACPHRVPQRGYGTFVPF